MSLNKMFGRFTFGIEAGLTIVTLLVLISGAGATTLIVADNGVKYPESINEIEVHISADRYVCYLNEHIKIIIKAKNTGDKILKNVSLQWVADTPIFDMEGGRSEPKDLAPGEERTEIFDVRAESAPDDSMITGWAYLSDEHEKVSAGSLLIRILEKPTPIPEFPGSSSVFSVASIMLLALFLLIQKNRKGG